MRMTPIASRWLRRAIRIAIHPDRLCIARVGSERHDRLLDARVIPLRSGAWPWDAPLAALRRVGDDFASRGAPVHVSLSSHFVRYLVLPWREPLRDRAAQVAFAQQCFRSLYGEVAAHWDVSVAGGHHRRNALAWAADREWGLGLEALFRDCRLGRATIQPWFLAACNRYRRVLDRHAGGCVAVVERGVATVGTFDRSGWSSLCVRGIEGMQPAQFAPALAQALRSSGIARIPERLFVITVGENACSLLQSRVRHWLTPSARRVIGLPPP
jgi:hypothetical protein